MILKKWYSTNSWYSCQVWISACHARKICPLQRRTNLLYLLGYRFQYWLDSFSVEHGHFQRSKADSDSSAGRNKAKGKFFREKYSGSVHTLEHPAPHKNVQVGRDDRVIPRGWYSGCSYYSSQTLPLKLSRTKSVKDGGRRYGNG